MYKIWKVYNYAKDEFRIKINIWCCRLEENLESGLLIGQCSMNHHGNKVLNHFTQNDVYLCHHFYRCRLPQNRQDICQLVTEGKKWQTLEHKSCDQGLPWILRYYDNQRHSHWLDSLETNVPVPWNESTHN